MLMVGIWRSTLLPHLIQSQMEWINKVDKIVCLNLLHRTDRFIDFTEQAEKYSIPFDRVNAIRDTESGARGLRDTMVKLFREEIDKGTEHLLVFEDDASIVVEPLTFHNTMDAVMKQLPENYHMVFLGCQITVNGCKFAYPNLIRVIKAFSTHSVLYSLQGMKEMVDRISYPIDNWIVDEIEPMGNSYCTYPFLCSQKPGISDIYAGNFIDWRPFLETRFEQRIHEIRR